MADVNIVSKIESVAIGTGTALYNLSRGWSEGHSYCIAESAFELTGAIATGQYYFAKFLDLLPLISLVFTTHIPYFIFMISHLIPLRIALGALGMITNAAKGIKEAMSLYRQYQFLDLFKKHAWKGSDTRNVLAGTIEHFDDPKFQESLPLKFRQIITDKKETLKQLLNNIDSGDQTSVEKAEKLFSFWTNRHVRDKLVEITNLSSVELERALPEWLYNDIVIQGEKTYLNKLLEKVNAGDTKAIEEATELLDTMESYARKKSIVHILKIIGAVINIVACIGFFVAFPWAVTVIFLILIGISGAVAYMYNAGYVENREDAFSLKLCVPEFIRNLAFDIWSSPDTIRAWLNEEKPKEVTPHPFYKIRNSTTAPRNRLNEKNVFTTNPFVKKGKEPAQHKALLQMPNAYSDERLERRIRLKAQGILLSGAA